MILQRQLVWEKLSIFCERLEFQARGAPHNHVLLWLKEPLGLEAIDQIMNGCLPDRSNRDLFELVSKKKI